MNFKKRFVATTLAAGLVLSPYSVFPNQANISSIIVYADEVSDLADRLLDVYNAIPEENRAALGAAREALINLDSEWTSILGLDGNGDSLVSVINSKLEGLTSPVAARDIIRDFAGIIYDDQGDFQANLESFRIQYAESFNAIFGDELTVDDMVEFISEFEAFISDPMFWLGALDSEATLDSLIQDAAENAATVTGLDGALANSLNIGISEVLDIKTRLNEEIDPDGIARNALISGVVQSKGGRIDGLSTIQPGVSTDFSFKIRYSNTDFDITDLVEWDTSDPGKATFDGNTLTVNALSSGTFDVYAKLLGVPVLTQEVTIESIIGGGSGDGTGGGSVPGGDGVPAENPELPPADVPVVVDQPTYEDVEVEAEVSTGTNAEGKTEATVTLDESQLATAAANSEEQAVNLVVEVTGDAEVYTAPISGKLVTDLTTLNSDNAITVNTPQGAVTVTASVLSNALTMASENGIDTSDAKVTIVSEKGSDADQAELETALGSSSENLAGLKVTKIIVSSGDATYEIQQSQGYITSSVVLDGTFDANQISGVEYRAANRVSAKNATVATAASHGTFAPVPTIIEYKDGKTIVYLKKKTNAPFTVVKTNKSFTDVTDQWFAQDVTVLANKLLVNGRTSSEFKPAGTLTRAEFATMIVRALGLLEDKQQGQTYTDVQLADWYTGYVGAASKAGIINGYTDGTFKPNASVSRQEAAKMIVQAIAYAGGNTSMTAEEKATVLAVFSDTSRVSNWAEDYVAFVAKTKILRGDNGNIKPGDNSSRAESATLLKRFMQAVNLITVK